MALLVVFLYALVVVTALLLIGIILIQPSKTGGVGATFGGATEAFGGKAGSHLTKATVVMTAIFFVLTLVLAALIGHGYKPETVEDDVTAKLKQSVKAEEKKTAVEVGKKSDQKVSAAKAAPEKNPAAGK